MSEIKSLIEKIEAAHFETAGGQLADFAPWLELKERIQPAPLKCPHYTPATE